MFKHQLSSFPSLYVCIKHQANKKTRNRAYAGADIQFTIRTKKGQESCPLHLAARLGCLPILKQLISHGCKINAGLRLVTALMLAARANQADCFLELIIAGAHLGLVNSDGDSAVQLAKRSVFGSSVANEKCLWILCGQHHPPEICCIFLVCILFSFTLLRARTLNYGIRQCNDL